MALKRERNAFVNRVDEVRVVVDFIDQKTPQDMLIVIADSGLGKSRLTEEAQKKARTTSVRISIGDVPSAVIPEGLVVQKLSRLLSLEAAKHRALPLSRFFLKRLPSTVRGSIMKIAAKKVASFLTDEQDAKDVIEETVATALEAQDNILDDASPQLTGLASEYIAHCSETFPFCVVVENSHLVDFSSIEFLVNELSTSQRVIFEYTSNNSKSFALDHFLEIFKERKDRIATLYLKPLSSTEAVKLVVDDVVTMAAFVESQFMASNGNLRPLLDAAVLLSRGYSLPDQIHNATEQLLHTIVPDQKFLIALLVLNENPTSLQDIVDANKLHDIFVDEKSLRLSLSTLIGSLVKQTQIDQFEVAHDFIRHVVTHSAEYRKFSFVALDCWRRIFQSRLPDVSSGIDRSQHAKSLSLRTAERRLRGINWANSKPD